MIEPEPERYYSDIKVYKKGGEIFTDRIEVNKPLTISGWKVYQSSYDKKMGKWSRLSILELVRDPWLPLFYVACIMMILGAVHLIYQGRKKYKLN